MNFLEARGGEILKHAKVAKIRKTVSKVVSGKAIIDDQGVQKIKTHIQSQASKQTK